MLVSECIVEAAVYDGRLYSWLTIQDIALGPVQ